MPAFKLVYIFKGFGALSTGWSEVWWTVAAGLDAASANALEWAKKRVLIMAGGNILQAVRISSNLPPPPPKNPPGTPPRQRLALLLPLGLQGQASLGDAGSLTWVAANVRWTDLTGTVFRVQQLRGLPDDAWTGGNDDNARALIIPWIKSVGVQKALGNFVIAHHVRGQPAPTYVPIGGGAYERLTRRATGRPFFLPHGRRGSKPPR